MKMAQRVGTGIEVVSVYFDALILQTFQQCQYNPVGHTFLCNFVLCRVY
jgi:hypothetical protein